jgi:hypothetical protein
MIKKRIYRLLLFVFILFILDQSIGRLIVHFASKYKFDQRIGNLINNQLNKDVFILGSSRALNGIDPETIEKETNLTCFNLSYSGSNILFHETLLDLILLSDNQPTTIIYNIDDPGTLLNLDNQVIYKKEELFPYVYNDNVNKIVADKLDKKVWATRLSATYHNNINLVSAVKYLLRGKEVPSIEINNIDTNGANLMLGHQKGCEDLTFEKIKFKYENESLAYANSFQNIISKCEKNNINLIIVSTPVYYAPTLGFKERISELSENKLVYNYPNEFIDNQYFYNHGHLNKKGAIRFSQLLAKDIFRTK